MKSLLFLLAIIILGVYFYSASFFVTLLVISFLIFFHELGHFLAAKSLKVKVEVFSIGFGKALLEKEFKGTAYRLSALPLGGYVKLKGQDDLKPCKEVFEKDSYSVLKPLQKIYILFAGPFFNLILAFLLYLTIAHLGVSKLAPTIGFISQNSTAQKAGLKVGDTILSVNGVQISSFDELRKEIKNESLTLVVQRADERLRITLRPELGEGYNEFLQIVRKPLIGIAPSNESRTFYYKGFDAFIYAYEESVQASTLIIKGLTKLIVGELDAKNLGGVITMVDFTSKASQHSLVSLFLITALISVNLGILNLLPIPMLDGGHIVFNLYELIFRRKVPAKAFEYLSYGGLALLLSVMIFATYNDIVRLVLKQ
ncbi:RIP metalloprotease RseP [Campylobacter sp. MIT 97-5078]|uniref:RIP metalloprotease RseP n=1 Tax=Campylobacter sp. MIT 97-5078 TaxID=1548153 RepID=UPI0005130EC9|nr:RIP metalloprotease RseP [Campylobacter sp. MIT 97-5078]KGI57379.1 zinc metalloprotease [Campylobacter sp. MIT 97-5078]TQR28284.1 RIP metalloprotease RseP [Campylobacter sp. MIT 97-5078]